ncbi:MAG: response regulator FixJ [Pseudomonadota bacterium]
MEEPDPIVFIVDDDDEVRDSLEDLIDSVGYQTEKFGSAADFLAGFDPSRSGCLVLDIRMPGMSGLELQERLNEEGISLPIIFITGHGDVPMAVEAMRRGAVDFIQKPFRDQDLLDRVNAALAEGVEKQRDSEAIREITGKVDSLTPRERQVLDMVVEGKANKVIAIDLDVSQRTVEVHRANVMDKMQARSLADLVRMMARIGE